MIKTSPPQGPTWKAHATSIVSIDLAEAKELIITASTDCCVRLWSKMGRYIGEPGFLHRDGWPSMGREGPREGWRGGEGWGEKLLYCALMLKLSAHE